jgi:hypothetical protein
VRYASATVYKKNALGKGMAAMMTVRFLLVCGVAVGVVGAVIGYNTAPYYADAFERAGLFAIIWSLAGVSLGLVKLLEEHIRERIAVGRAAQTQETQTMAPNASPATLLKWLSLLMVGAGGLGLVSVWFGNDADPPIHPSVFAALCAIGTGGLAFLAWLKR